MSPTRLPKSAVGAVDEIHPAVRPAPSTIDPQTELYVAPFASKVNELPAKDRPLALSAVARTSSKLASASLRGALQRVLAFKAGGHMPIASAPKHRPKCLTLEAPNKGADKKSRAKTLPGYTPLRSVSRRTVSAPLPPLYPPPARPSDGPTSTSSALLLRSAIDRPVPNTPIGNAFDGEHFWRPQFSPQVAVRPAEEERDPEILRTPTEPVSKTAYLAAREEVDVLSAKLFHDAAKKDEPVSRLECDVEAARRVFSESNDAFVRSGEKFPHPYTVSARMFALAEDENRVLASFGIRTPADLLDTRRWMRVDETTLQVSTILDSAREAMALLRDRRKSIGLEPSAAAYTIVHALVVLQEKKKKLERSRSDDDSGDELGYIEFLKSIGEEVEPGERTRTVGISKETAALAEGRSNEEKANASEGYEPPPYHLSQIGWDDIKDKGKSVESAPELSLNPCRRSLQAEVVAPRGWRGRTFVLETDNDTEEATLRTRGVSSEPRSGRTASGGRAGNLEKRKERGKAPNAKDLASWADEMKRLEMETPPKAIESPKKDGGAARREDATRDDSDFADKNEQIGLAITTDE